VCLCETSSSHGGGYDVQNCLLGYRLLPCKMIVDRRFRGAYCLHETSVDNHFTRQDIPEDNSEQQCVNMATHYGPQKSLTY
jgi:hypothetical protein